VGEEGANGGHECVVQRLRNYNIFARYTCFLDVCTSMSPVLLEILYNLIPN
jgi:hypothetical protein